MGQIVIPYKPRELARDIHDNLMRWSVLVCHRRFGKTVLSINELIKRNFQNTLPEPRYAYIAPHYKQAKAVAWDYLKHYSRPIPGIQINEAELRIDYPNGGRIRLYGADNPDSLRGIYLDGAVLDEYAQMHPKLFGEVIRPALSDRKGWAIFIGTPKGRNAFFDLFNFASLQPDWLVRVYKASETALVDQSELDDAKKMMTDDEYNQEYECSWTAAVHGAYYAKQMALARDEKRICKIPIEASLPVYTFWDLGIGDATAIWFMQPHGKELRMVYYYENSGEGLNHYINKLHDLRDKHGFSYKEHYAPHDIRVRELTDGKTRLDKAAAMGIKFEVVPNIPIIDGIQAGRDILSKVWFDEERCELGIKCLENYRSDYDDKKDMIKDKPLHDWSSHGSDAFRYFAVGWRGQTIRLEETIIMQNNYDPFA